MWAGLDSHIAIGTTCLIHPPSVLCLSAVIYAQTEGYLRAQRGRTQSDMTCRRGLCQPRDLRRALGVYPKYKGRVCDGGEWGRSLRLDGLSGLLSEEALKGPPSLPS